MKKEPILSILIGLLGAVASYSLIIIDTLTFGGNVFAYVFLPFHIAIAAFVVFLKKPTALQVVLRILVFIPVYILIIKSYLNFYVYDIVMNYSATPPEIHVAIIFDLIVICLTFIIAGIIRISFYANEKAVAKMNMEN